MYGMALALSAATTAGTVGMPFFQLGSIGPIQSFGIIVAAGVLIGAALLRRYAEWHGVSDDHIRGLTGWITICGFLGAHVFDAIAYHQGPWGPLNNDPSSWWFLPRGLWPSNWPLIFRIWDGISSYGGFLGGAMGFAWYVWWKRQPVRLFADIAIVGLLPAFSIGRIGCTVVSDHIGALVDRSAWYASLAMEYPTSLNMDAIHDLVKNHPELATKPSLLAWNLGFIEFLYLVPVNALILWLAFRSKKRINTGFLTALTGVLYAPVRFFLDYLRPANTDPRYLGFTFAQWASILAFGAAAYLAFRIFQNGKVAETVTTTSGEAQERLKRMFQEESEALLKEEKKGGGAKKPAGKSNAKKAPEKPREREPEKEKTAAERKADLIAAIKREKKSDEKTDEPGAKKDDA